jgi:hypothetical protein
MEIYARRTFILDGSLNPNRSNLLKAHGRIVRLRSSSRRICATYVSNSYHFHGTVRCPRPSDCRQVACIQGKDPRALQSRRGVHLATGSKGSKLHHMVPIQRTNPAVLILPLGVRPTASSGSCYLAMWQLLPCFLCNLV